MGDIGEKILQVVWKAVSNARLLAERIYDEHVRYSMSLCAGRPTFIETVEQIIQAGMCDRTRPCTDWISRQEYLGAIEKAKKEAYEQGLEVGNAKLKENFKHWTDVAMKEAYEDAAKITFDEMDHGCNACHRIIEKLREKADDTGGIK